VLRALLQLLESITAAAQAVARKNPFGVTSRSPKASEYQGEPTWFDRTQETAMASRTCLRDMPSSHGFGPMTPTHLVATMNCCLLPAEDLFSPADRLAVAAQWIDIGGVDGIDAAGRGGIQDRAALRDIALQPEGHGAQAELADAQAVRPNLVLCIAGLKLQSEMANSTPMERGSHQPLHAVFCQTYRRLRSHEAPALRLEILQHTLNVGCNLH
jgi:hypothetical protein